jgi:hypothetical protein
MSLIEEIIIENLDHLGIVAGLIDEIGIVELINQKSGVDNREKITTGQVIKALILNGLGMVSRPLYLLSQFFEDKAIEKLLPTFRTSLCSTKRYMNYHQNLSQQIKQINSIEHKKISNPFKIKVLITYPVAIFYQLYTHNFWLISSTIPISSINPATIPKWSRFLTVIDSIKDIFLILNKDGIISFMISLEVTKGYK